MIIRVSNPVKKRGKKNMVKRKKRRTPAQIRATKNLVALNKKRRKKNPVSRKPKTMVVSKPKRKKRRTIMANKRTIRKRSYKPRKTVTRKYRRRKNPGINFVDILTQALLAGLGGMGVLFGSNGLAKMLKLPNDNQKNLIALLMAVMAGTILPKYMKGNQANSIANGAMAVVWIKFIKNFLPANMKDMFLLGESSYKYPISDQVNRLVDSVLGSDYSGPGLNLLGTAEIGESELSGSTYDNMISAERW